MFVIIPQASKSWVYYYIGRLCLPERYVHVPRTEYIILILIRSNGLVLSTEHYGVHYEYRHHGDVRDPSRMLSIILFKLASLALLTLKLLCVRVMHNYQVYKV